MASNVLNTIIMLRSGTEVERKNSPLVLKKGEAFVSYSSKVVGDEEVIQQQLYFGDGLTALKNLAPATLTPEEIKALVDAAAATLAVTDIPADAENSEFVEVSLTSADGETVQKFAIKGKNLGVSADENGVITLDNSELNNASKITIEKDTDDPDWAGVYKFYQGTKIVSEEVDDLENPIADSEGREPDDPDWEPTYGKKTVEKEVPDELLGEISLPKDMVVEDGEVVEITQEMIDEGDYPDSVTDPGWYITLKIANSEGTVLYVPAEGLVDSLKTEQDAKEVQLTIDTDKNEISAEIVEMSVMKLRNSENEDDVLILYGGGSGAPEDVVISLQVNEDNSNDLDIIISAGENGSVNWAVYAGTVILPGGELASGTVADYLKADGAIVTATGVLATAQPEDKFTVVVNGVSAVYTA